MLMLGVFSYSCLDKLMHSKTVNSFVNGWLHVAVCHDAPDDPLPIVPTSPLPAPDPTLDVVAMNSMTSDSERLRMAIKDAQSKAKGKQAAVVTLWVRAGSDGLRNGADPMCQHIFMILLRKSLDSPSGECQFNVKTVNTGKPHAEFRDLGLRQVPAAVFSGDVYEHPDDIIEFLDSRFPRPALQYFDPDADDATTDLFAKFCWFIKEVNKDSRALEKELERIDDHLRENGTKFLTGGSVTHLDCRIMPVLHHIRIAALALKDYRIPKSLSHLWTYLKHTYDCEVFLKSVPSDQEIVLYWAQRPDTTELPPAKLAELARQEPITTLTVE